MDCVFCNIATGASPALIIDRVKGAVAFLPATLEARGHTLVVPTDHYENLLDVPISALTRVLGLTQTLCHHYTQAIGATGFNLLHASGASAQQTVSHFHVHLIPRFDGDGVEAWPLRPEEALDRNAEYDILRRIGS